jgi:hypothetical protein
LRDRALVIEQSQTGLLHWKHTRSYVLSHFASVSGR